MGGHTFCDVIGVYISTATALTVSAIHLKMAPRQVRCCDSSTPVVNKTFLEFMSASGQKSVTSRKSVDVSVAFLKYGRYTKKLEPPV